MNSRSLIEELTEYDRKQMKSAKTYRAEYLLAHFPNSHERLKKAILLAKDLTGDKIKAFYRERVDGEFPDSSSDEDNMCEHTLVIEISEGVRCRTAFRLITAPFYG